MSWTPRIKLSNQFLRLRYFHADNIQILDFHWTVC
jgi:hypothetical protein